MIKNLFLAILLSFPLAGGSQVDDYSLRIVGETEITFIDRRTEKHVICYENGALKTIRYFRDGVPHGEWKEFWENGSIYGEASHENGKRIGEWRFYNTEGELVTVMNYENNKMVSAYMFDPKTNKLISWK